MALETLSEVQIAQGNVYYVRISGIYADLGRRFLTETLGFSLFKGSASHAVLHSEEGVLWMAAVMRATALADARTFSF